MYYDSLRKAYVDKDTGETVFQEEEEHIQPTIVQPPTPLRNEQNIEYDDIEQQRAREFERLFELARKEVQQNTYNELEVELIEMHRTGQTEHTDALVTAPPADDPEHSDWTFARALQALEFEIPVDAYENDFGEKEYRASRSCRRQLLTISFFICLVQLGLLIAMIQEDGYASSTANSTIGPPVTTLVRYGAKEAGLIVHKKEWWRLLSCIMLHAGIWHIIPNVAIQLRVGGYLNLVYGTPKWLWIYFVSGIFGAMQSCLFLPSTVGVGSSGALMGMLSSWVVWIVFRWQKIPPQCKSQRNCQLMVVTAAIVVTLATSAMPNVDWAAHLGGAVQGVLWGFILLSSELDNSGNRFVFRVAAAFLSAVLFACSLYYMIDQLKPSEANFSLWDKNDDWR